MNKQIYENNKQTNKPYFVRKSTTKSFLLKFYTNSKKVGLQFNYFKNKIYELTTYSQQLNNKKNSF